MRYPLLKAIVDPRRDNLCYTCGRRLEQVKSAMLRCDILMNALWQYWFRYIRCIYCSLAATVLVLFNYIRCRTQWCLMFEISVALKRSTRWMYIGRGSKMGLVTHTHSNRKIHWQFNWKMTNDHANCADTSDLMSHNSERASWDLDRVSSAHPS